jgi:L-threonylcarbamoyladenylate synthase
MTMGQSDGCGTEVLDGRDPASISKAADILKSGGLVAFPTETVYGLGADGLNQSAVENIYEAKGRPKNNPLILHIASIEAAVPLVVDWPRMAQKLADKYWPGPLTIVLQASGLVPGIVKAGNPTVALRSPAHPVALDLLREFNGPLAAPSANRAMELSPTRPEHVVKALGGVLDLVLDGGPTSTGIESTIINLAETPPRVLRPGPISISELEETVGSIAVFCGAIEYGAKQAAPGMSIRHYAPKAKLNVHGSDELLEVLNDLAQGGGKFAAIVFGEDISVPPELHGCTIKRLPGDPRGAMANIYAALHDLDSIGCQRVLVQEPPQSDEWLAIRDRLSRAAFKE